VSFTARFEGLDAFLSDLGEAVNEGTEAAVERHGDRVAGAARADHPYTDRTGDLTASLEGLPAMGSALDGTLQGGTVAGTEYASYVEEGTERSRAYPYLEPAATLTEPAFEQDADAQLQASLARKP